MAKPREFGNYYKIMIIGDTYVGKTCLLLRFRKSVFRTIYRPTIGFAKESPTIELDGKRIQIQLWETIGAERFRSIRTHHYVGTWAIMIVYDVTNEKSFDNITNWIRYTEERAPIDVERIIIGNKCDMRERKVEREKGENLAREHGFLFFETSAKENINVEEAIEFLVRSLKAKVHANRNPPGYDDQSGLHSKKDLGFWASCSLT